ncbi:HTH-type transcriptional activator RhaS [compost metagenome]
MKAFHEQRTYHSGLLFSAWTPKNIQFLAHWHEELELICVLEGELRMGINSEMRLLQAGEMAVCSSGDIHYYDSENLASKALIVCFHPQMIGFPGGWPSGVGFRSPFIGSAEIGHSEIEKAKLFDLLALMYRMYFEWTEQQSGYEMVIKGLVYELCGLLLRTNPTEIADAKRDKRRVINTGVMQKALEYIEDHYMNSISIEDTANYCNMSMFHFSRFFKMGAGIGFNTYLNSYRIQQAEHLIVTSDLSMLDISIECGFNNVRTFNRVFKQIKKCRPTDLR